MSKSIMQNKDGCCYMCDLLGTRQQGYTIEEHHCFGGPNRKLSEKYGLKSTIQIRASGRSSGRITCKV